MVDDLSVGIVLYKPEIENIAVIQQLSVCSFPIFVYWNEFDIACENHCIILSMLERLNVTICIDYNNSGLSVAYNVILGKLKTKFYMFLDQDTAVSVGDIGSIYKCATQLFYADPCVAAVAPNVCCSYDEQGSIKRFTRPTKVPWFINSGTVLSAERVVEVGKYDENLFVDFVDLDLCKRLTLKGFTILQLPEPIIYQSLGEKTSFLGFKSYYHSLSRLASSIKSKRYLYSKYNQNWKLYLFLIKQLIRASIFGPNRIIRVLLILRMFFGK